MPRYELRVKDQIYTGWKSLRMTRGLERAASDFDLSVSEKWQLLEQAQSWRIRTGDACTISRDGELLLTGYVETYAPRFTATTHEVRCAGRSKTCDFVDSSVVYETDGQFRGLTPGQLARQLAEPFGIEVVSTFDGDPIHDTQVQQGETCFALVERLSRLQEILVTDDAHGRLVLTRAGAGYCSTALVQGRNILIAGADFDDSERFSEYLVKAQRPGAAGPWDNYGEAPATPRDGRSAGAWYRARRLAGEDRPIAPKTMTQISGTVRDEGITRYRPLVIVAEEQADGDEAQKRADWEMRRRLAKAKEANITINGWRQADGRMLLTNENAMVTSSWLDLDEPLLISEIEYAYGDGGELVTLKLVLPDVFLPEPKRQTKAGKGEGGGKGGKGGKGGGAEGGNWAHVLKGSGNE
jgi:prophage tail gpP-like protein